MPLRRLNQREYANAMRDLLGLEVDVAALQMVVFQNKGYDSGDCIAARPLKNFESQYGDASRFVSGALHSLNLAYSPD